ncbi:MAG: LysR family transcriptional regulator [Bdellovibrionales bacterium]|nr:LysR family transcriptional regulator [Bdellovibrionales bacterium]
MKKWLNYHHLLYFKVIAEEQSVSKAAEKLLLGQPTLSTQLKQFEDRIGTKLFDRQSGGLQLTEHGKVVFQYAQKIFNLGDELQDLMEGSSELTHTTLRVGALDSIPRQVISKIVMFARKNTKCKVEIFDDKSEHLLSMLKQNQLDLVLTTFLPESDLAEGLFPKLISKTPVAFFGAKEEAHLAKGFPESIKDYPIVMPTYDSKLRYDIDVWFQERGWEPYIIVESQDISVKKSIAMDDIGILPTAEHTVSEQASRDG